MEIVARDLARANGPESEVQEVTADNNLPNIISDSEDDDSDSNQVAGASIAAPGRVTSAVAPNLPIAGNGVATRLRSANLGRNGGGVTFTAGTTAAVVPRTSQVRFAN